jgi:hypothetical protein
MNAVANKCNSLKNFICKQLLPLDKNASQGKKGYDFCYPQITLTVSHNLFIRIKSIYK